MDLHDPVRLPDVDEHDALSIVETVGALVACAVIAATPVWLAVLVDALVPGAGAASGVVAFFVVLVLPAVVRTRRTRHMVGRGARWGANVAFVLRLPIETTRALRRRRTARALGARATSAAVAAVVDDDARAHGSTRAP